MTEYISTSYGVVQLTSRFDPMVGTFYDAYDDNGNYLGELSDVPSNDEGDQESIDRLKEYIEYSIDWGDIKHPMDASIISEQVWIVTECERKEMTVTAASYPFRSEDDCKNKRKQIIDKFIKSLGDNEYETTDSDDSDDQLTEIITADQSRYLCVTYKLIEY